MNREALSGSDDEAQKTPCCREQPQQEHKQTLLLNGTLDVAAVVTPCFAAI